MKLKNLPQNWLTVLSTAVAALAAPVVGHADTEKVLNVYNWSEYIGANTVKAFEKETGIKVHYDNFDSNELVMAKMVAGKTGYDIIIPSSDFGRMMVDGGLIKKIDRSKLPLWGNLSPIALDLMSKLDPGNQYMVPWLGSAITVGYNPVLVQKALGTVPVPADPFELVFNPAYTSKLKKCGIAVYDTAASVFPSALIYLGKSGASKDKAELEAAYTLMKSVRGDISTFTFNGHIADLAAGNLCVALAPGGDFSNANAKAIASGSAARIVAPLPPKGVWFGYESMMIPVDAPHPENALAWINFILRPEVQAEITNKVFFTSPNQAARKFIKPEIVNNPMAFPPDDYMKTKVQFYQVQDNATRRIVTRFYTKFKTGM